MYFRLPTKSMFTSTPFSGSMNASSGPCMLASPPPVAVPADTPWPTGVSPGGSSGGLPWLPRHLVQFVHETKTKVRGSGELPLAEERVSLNHADEVHGLAVAQPSVDSGDPWLRA